MSAFSSDKKYPITLKPLTAPDIKSTFQDVFNLQNALRLLLHDLDAELAKYVQEAPADGKLYGRKNKTWSEVTGGVGGGSSLIDSPSAIVAAGTLAPPETCDTYLTTVIAGVTYAIPAFVERSSEIGTDPYWASVVSLMSFDQTLTDAKGVSWTDSGTSYAGGRYGSGSLYTAGGNISAPVASWNDFSYGTGDFTVEMYIKRLGDSHDTAIFSHQYVGGDSMPLVIGVGAVNTTSSANTLFIGAFIGGAWLGTTSSLTPAIGQWYHIAAVRSGATYTLYVAGTAVASFSSTVSSVATKPLLIGRRWDNWTAPQIYFAGCIDEMRITKGVARYTSNFTPPTLPFPRS